MLPAQSPGAFSIQQSITLNLRTPLSLRRSADHRERSSHLQKLLWRKQDSNLQPQGYEPRELPIAPFRSLKYAICMSYSAKIGTLYI